MRIASWFLACCTICLCLLGSFVAHAQEVAPQGGEGENRRVQVGARYGLVFFSKVRAYERISDELLDKGGNPGQVFWPRVSLTFNPDAVSRPIFGMFLGNMLYWAENKRSYPGGHLKVKVLGDVIEGGFRLGVKPALDWLFLYGEIGNGMQFYEKVSVSSPAGKEEFDDEARPISTTLSGGVKFELLDPFQFEGVISLGLFDADDSMFTLGAYYAF